MKKPADGSRVPFTPPGVAHLPCQAPRFALILLLAGVIALALPASSQANQVFKACGKKWVKQVRKLAPEQLAWMTQERSASFAGDLDGDGRKDTLTVANRPSFRQCNVRENWDRRETTVRIEYGNGKTQVFFWIDGLVLEDLKLIPEANRILVRAKDTQGRPFAKWLQYRGTPPPEVEAVVAENRLGEPEPLGDPGELTEVAGEAVYQVADDPPEEP